MGARRETFFGLSGIGDMTLTAASLQSRNTAFGVALGEGASPQELLRSRRGLVEGVFSVEAVVALATSPERRATLGAQAARAVIDRGLTWEANARRVESLMHRLVAF